MRKYLLTAALVAIGLPMTPAMARSMNGYIVRSTVMRAGPDFDYPAVQRLRRDSGVTVHGCLRNWNWCDVSSRYDRGWVARRDIVVRYNGRRRYIGSSMGIIILSFSFGNYWDNNYRSRPFYSQRPRWEQHYNNTYQPSWGPRSTAPNVTPQPRLPETGRRQGGRPQGQAPAPSAPQVAPQQRQPGAPQIQRPPEQQQAAPERRGNQGRQVTPGNQSGGQHGNSHEGPNKGRKQHN